MKLKPCPFCGGENINVKVLKNDMGMEYCACVCACCGAKGSECYTHKHACENIDNATDKAMHWWNT